MGKFDCFQDMGYLKQMRVPFILEIITHPQKIPGKGNLLHYHSISTRWTSKNMLGCFIVARKYHAISDWMLAVEIPHWCQSFSVKIFPDYLRSEAVCTYKRFALARFDYPKTLSIKIVRNHLSS